MGELLMIDFPGFFPEGYPQEKRKEYSKMIQYQRKIMRGEIVSARREQAPQERTEWQLDEDEKRQLILAREAGGLTPAGEVIYRKVMTADKRGALP
jgi:hypothetical protein